MKKLFLFIMLITVLLSITGCKSKCEICGSEEADNNFNGKSYCDSCYSFVKYADEAVND